MFHVEMRMGMNVVREFNLSEQRLWLGFLEPLMADRDFTIEGHDFSPRKTRLKVYEGSELRPDQMGMGRGWQNVERSAVDVTERVLAQAREHTAGSAVRTGAPQTPDSAPPSAPPTATAGAPAAADLLRERLIGRTSAGPIGGREIIAIASELMPDADDEQRLEAARQVAWQLLERGAAQLAPSDR